MRETVSGIYRNDTKQEIIYEGTTEEIQECLTSRRHLSFIHTDIKVNETQSSRRRLSLKRGFSKGSGGGGGGVASEGRCGEQPDCYSTG